MNLVREPAVAGLFYPAEPAELAAEVDGLLRAAPPPPPGPPPKVIIVPHAGYAYSGSIAAAGFARVAPGRDRIERVVLIGPAHHVPVEGLAAPRADAFATPLGTLVVDDDARRALLACSGVVADDRPHAPEHSLEVQLPFLQRTLGEVLVLPIVAGRAATAIVADALAAVWGGTDTLVVVSTDLSHYHDYDTAAELDRRTAAAIVARDAAGIAGRDACGAVPVRGALETARRLGLDVELVALGSSGDTAGTRDRVVGYGAFALS